MVNMNIFVIQVIALFADLHHMVLARIVHLGNTCMVVMAENANSVDQHQQDLVHTVLMVNMRNNYCFILQQIQNFKMNIYTEKFLSIFFTGLFTILAGIIGYWISLRNEKKRFIWDCYVAYLETVNIFHIEFLKILIDLEDLEKLPVFLMKEASQIVEFTNRKNFYYVREDAIEMNKTMKSLQINETNDVLQAHYKLKYIDKVKKLTDYDIFTTMATEFKRNSARYSFFISSELRNIGNQLYYDVVNARKNEMREFDIWAFEEKISNFESNIEEELTKLHIKGN